jgi:hypothetical protein
MSSTEAILTDPVSRPAPFINAGLLAASAADDAFIVFTHAQRTGGSAFQREMIRGFGEERLYLSKRRGSKPWRELTAADFLNKKAYAGHVNFEEKDFGRPVYFVSLLRHPLYRVASLYFYAKKKDGHKFRQLANDASFEDFYTTASNITPSYFRNTQCWRIGGKPNSEIAMAAIHEHYIGVGFTSNLLPFFSLIAEAHHWPAPKLTDRDQDESRYDHLISNALRDRILEDNLEDLSLYNNVRKAANT